jgi:hypothetical protein
VGQAVPLLLGRIRNAPVLMAIAGLIDKLKEPITAAVPPNGGSLALSTPDIVARLPTSGTMQLRVNLVNVSNSSSTTAKPISLASGETPGGPDIPPYPEGPRIGQNSLSGYQGGIAECISYQAVDVPGARLLQITRGARETMAGDADAGTDVYQVLPEYVALAGVNLGPLGIQALTAVYCDGMAKNPSQPPVHTIELENTTYWPPYNLTLVRFTGGEPITPWIQCAENKEHATRGNGCSQVNTISGIGNEFAVNGIPVMRLGIDAPCGSSLEHFQCWFRFHVADKPVNPGTVTFRFWRGVYTSGNAGAGIGKIQLVYFATWQGPLAGGIGSRLTEQDPAVWNGAYALNPGSPCSILGIVMDSAEFRDEYVYADITAGYNAAKAAGNSNLVLLLRGYDFWEHIEAGKYNLQPYTTIHGIHGPVVPPYTAAWYAIGAGAPGASSSLPTAPMLFLGAGGTSGALLTRPNAGTAARSAAEASLGFVTVDVTGPIETVEVPPPIGAGGGLFGFVDGFESGDLSHWSYVSPGVTISTNVRGGGVTGKYCLEGGELSIQRGFGHVLAAPQRLRIYVCVRSWSYLPGGALHHHVAGFVSAGGYSRQHEFGFHTYSISNIAHKRFFASIAGTTFAYSPDYDWQIGVWYRFEARMEGLTIGQPGTVTVNIYLGDTMTLISTISATGTLAGDSPSNLLIGPHIQGGGVTITMAYDDLVLSSIDDGEIGPGGVWLAIPSADVEYNMTPNTGITNYSRVDDWPGSVDDDGSYVSAATPMLDRYRIMFPSGAPAASKRLRHSNLMMRTQKTDGLSVETYGVVWTHAGAKYTGGLSDPDPSLWTWVLNGGPSALMRWADVDAITVSNFTIGVERAAGPATLHVSALAWNLDFH